MGWGSVLAPTAHREFGVTPRLIKLEMGTPPPSKPVSPRRRFQAGRMKKVRVLKYTSYTLGGISLGTALAAHDAVGVVLGLLGVIVGLLLEIQEAS